MLMLIGIVVTNAIVLIDLINQYRAQGLGIVEAVIEGGRRRLRPILMTAVATIFALIPMALGLTGSGGFISQPLAIVVIGGLRQLDAADAGAGADPVRDGGADARSVCAASRRPAGTRPR